jgi:hypothetical protein
VASAEDGLKTMVRSNLGTYRVGDQYTVDAGADKVISVQPNLNFFKVEYTNGGTIQGLFDLETKFVTTDCIESSHRVGDPIVNQDDASLGIVVITGEKESGDYVPVKLDESGRFTVNSKRYKDAIAEGDILNHFPLNKFGRNETVGATEEVVWEYSGVYEYLNDDTFAQMYLSSDNNADTGIEYTIEGLDCEYNEFSITVDSNGFAFVPIDTLCDGTVHGAGAGDDGFGWRIYRAYCTESKINPEAGCAAGIIYISKDNTDTSGGANGIPDTVTDIQITVSANKNQTNFSGWSVPVGMILFIDNYYVSNGLTNKVTKVDLYVRPFGSVFRGKKPVSINTGYTIVPYDVPLVVTGKSDIVIKASTSGAGGDISAGFSGWWELE